jgi:hypothetical protein
LLNTVFKWKHDPEKCSVAVRKLIGDMAIALPNIITHKRPPAAEF